MRLLDTTAVGAAMLLLSVAEAKHTHRVSRLEVLERKHSHNHMKLHASSRAENDKGLEKRGQCQFPSDAGLVAVNPGGQNGGWAMSPDQPCTPGKYCPYACPPGQLMAQWDPTATSYTYPQSMNGGLYCDSNGQVSKPFPNKPYCYGGTGSVAAKNSCGSPVAYCQTVLPGNEAMLIPTFVDSTATLAVPGTDYWASTAAHYYINPPGVSTAAGCIWGDGSQPIGNWSPYVAGANTDGNGNTFVKIAWNPIYTGESTFSHDLPKFGVKITCDGGGCNGLPCSIDPSVVSVNGVTSSNSATGAGGGNFCVVTVPKGSQAHIETFDVGGSGGGSKKVAAPDAAAPASKEPQPTPTPTPEPTSTPTPTPTSSPVSNVEISTSVEVKVAPPSKIAPVPHYTNAPHILFENITSPSSSSSSNSSVSTTSVSTATLSSLAPSATTSKPGAAANVNVSARVLALTAVFATVLTYLL